MQENKPREGWEKFLELCCQIERPELLKQFLDLFLTIEEKQNIASRYQIIKALLDEQMPQREIAEKYRVSIAQITRGSNALKIIEPELKKFLKSHIVSD